MIRYISRQALGVPMFKAIFWCGLFYCLLTPGLSMAQAALENYKITILSTMLADDGKGEWGFAALLEVDGTQVLVDTGNYPDTVLFNARELGIDLSKVEDVVLTHFHNDHTGGMVKLRETLKQENPKALSRIHVAPGIFDSRPGRGGRELNRMIARKPILEAGGAHFVFHEGPTQLIPGLWLTGPVPRVHVERNWSGRRQRLHEGELVEDTLPEDMSVALLTTEGVVVVAGCAHAGMVNIFEHSADFLNQSKIHSALGGFHLFESTPEHLDWTAQQLQRFGLETFVAAHCTGVESFIDVRKHLGLSRETAVMGAVGAVLGSKEGLRPGYWLDSDQS